MAANRVPNSSMQQQTLSMLGRIDQYWARRDVRSRVREKIKLARQEIRRGEGQTLADAIIRDFYREVYSYVGLSHGGGFMGSSVESPRVPLRITAAGDLTIGQLEEAGRDPEKLRALGVEDPELLIAEMDALMIAIAESVRPMIDQLMPVVEAVGGWAQRQGELMRPKLQALAEWAANQDFVIEDDEGPEV